MLWSDWHRAEFRVGLGWFNKLFNRLKNILCNIPSNIPGNITHSDMPIAIGAPQPEQVFMTRLPLLMRMMVVSMVMYADDNATHVVYMMIMCAV